MARATRTFGFCAMVLHHVVDQEFHASPEEINERRIGPKTNMQRFVSTPLGLADSYEHSDLLSKVVLYF